MSKKGSTDPCTGAGRTSRSREILVPIVDDALSRVAIAYAHDVARNFDSTLLFCTLDESLATKVSVTEAVVYSSNVPVLVVRSPLPGA